VIVQLFLIAHLAGDFFLQSGMAVQRKHRSFSGLAMHAALYLACVTAVSFFALPPGRAWPVALTLSLFHIFVDGMKSLVLRNHLERDGLALFLVDQAIHVATILVVVRLAVTAGPVEGTPLRHFINTYGEGPVAQVVLLLLLYLLCLQPASILVRKVLQSVGEGHLDTEGGAGEAPDRAGRAIGMLERAVILTLGLVGQLGAIGLIVAAKSVARFNRLAADRSFAERYLVGTLASVLAALLCVGYWSIAG